MTDNEIIKVLEDCSESCGGKCKLCPIYHECEQNDCFLDKQALDLINRQNAEIERLNKEVNLVSIQFQDLQERNDDERNEVVKEFSKSLIGKTHGGKISSTDILDFVVDYLRGENNG